jgi:hypothetical protein
LADPVNETFRFSQTGGSRPFLSESRANLKKFAISMPCRFSRGAGGRQKGSVSHVCPADFS